MNQAGTPHTYSITNLVVWIVHGLAPAFNQRQEQKRDRRLIPDHHCGDGRRATGEQGSGEGEQDGETGDARPSRQGVDWDGGVTGEQGGGASTRRPVARGSPSSRRRRRAAGRASRRSRIRRPWRRSRICRPMRRSRPPAVRMGRKLQEVPVHTISSSAAPRS
jgi:hypothetical protein